MTSVRLDADEDTTAQLIRYWLAVYNDKQVDVDKRCEAATQLDRLLRAPAWSS